MLKTCVFPKNCIISDIAYQQYPVEWLGLITSDTEATYWIDELHPHKLRLIICWGGNMSCNQGTVSQRFYELMAEIL